MATEDQIKKTIAEELGLDFDELEDDSFLADNLGADPYDLEDLAAALNEEFDIEIDESDIDQWSTVADVIATVLEKVEE